MNKFILSVNNILIFENTILKNIHKSGNIFDYKSDCKNTLHQYNF